MRAERARKRSADPKKILAETGATVDNISVESPTLPEDTQEIEVELRDDFSFVNEVSTPPRDPPAAPCITVRAARSTVGTSKIFQSPSASRNPD